MFDFQRFFYPFVFYLAGILALFIAFPMEMKSSTTMVYDYSTSQLTPKTTINYTAVYLSAVLTIACLIWLASQGDVIETSTLRDFEAVLYDENSRGFLAMHDITAPFKIVHDHILGDYPEGTIGVGVVLNRKRKPITAHYIKNMDYEKTTTRPKSQTPILGFDDSVAHPEDYVRAYKRSLRMTEEKLVENALKRVEGASEAKKEYFRKRAEQADEVDVDG